MRSYVALLLACSSALACSPAPPPPPPPPHLTAKPPSLPPTAAATAEPPSGPRTYSDLGAPRLVRQLGTEADDIALSPDGLLALVGNGRDDVGVQVWDVDRHVVVAELSGPSLRGPVSFGFSRDGRTIVTKGTDSAALWGASTGKLLREVPLTAGTNPDLDYVRPQSWTQPRAFTVRKIAARCLEAQGRAVCTDGPAVYLADLRAAETVITRLPMRTTVSASFDDAGGGLLLSCPGGVSGAFGFSSGSAELAAAEKKARLRTAAAQDTGGQMFDLPGVLLAVAPGRIGIWDSKTGKKRADIKDETIINESLIAPSPDGKWLAIGEPGGGTKIDLFDLVRGAHVRELDHGYHLWSVGWNPSGSILVTTGRHPAGGQYLDDDKASVKLWSVGTGTVARTEKGYYNSAYSQNGSIWVTWSYDAAQVWDASTFNKLSHVKGANMSVLPSPTGAWMITPAVDTSASHPGLFEADGIRVHDARTGKVVSTLHFKPGVTAWSADGSRLLASAALDMASDTMGRAFNLGVYTAASGAREQSWSSSSVVRSAGFALSDKLVVTTFKGLARVSRVKDGASLWLQPVVAAGRCTAVAYDDAGHFDADDAVLSSAEPAVRARLGDDLRQSDMVSTSAKLDSLRVKGLYRTFIDASK